jgi:uncharacterized protein YbcI
MLVKDAERILAQELANIRKKIVGRGPEDLQVYIHGDTILVRATNLWTTSEIFFISFIQQENLLPTLHEQFLEKAVPLIEQALSTYVKVKVVDMSINAYTKQNIANAIILLDINFEKEIKQLDR